MTLYEKRPRMLCAKCFVLFVLGREGGGVRDNYIYIYTYVFVYILYIYIYTYVYIYIYIYTRDNYAITELSRDN